jgi:N-acyl-phosphatidylethanolamine-hydrolysing phospholipase D
MLGARARTASIGLLLGLASGLGAPEARAGVAGIPSAPRDAAGRFANLAGPIDRAGVGVTLPFGLRRFWASLAGRDGAPPVVANDGAFLRENARHSVPTVTWVGHATLLVQMGGVTLLTDPTWSRTASPVSWLGPRRYVEPGLALESLPPVDVVLISHNHFDHLDLPTLERLARRGAGTRFLVPLGNGELLRSRGIEAVDELDWGEARTLSGVEILCTPAQHWSRRGLRDERRALWSSWVVTAPDRRFYFGGDTGYFSGFAAIGAARGPFDLAAVPIGAYEPAAMMRPFHLDPEEAVRAGRDLGARRVLGIHFGTFDLSDEPLDEPPRRFRAAAEAAGYPASDAWILAIGETRSF